MYVGEAVEWGGRVLLVLRIARLLVYILFKFFFCNVKVCFTYYFCFYLLKIRD